MHEAVSAISSTGTSPIVRIPGAEGWMVKRALDAGAHGVVVPLLQTPNEASSLVRAAKFPPQGIRGFGSPFPMGAFSNPGSSATALSSADYLAQANDALLTIIQIETAEALQSVEEIAALPGVDVLFIGPFDLGINIGHPIKDDVIDAELSNAIETVRGAAEKAGKRTGMFCTSAEQAHQYAEAGFHMISIAADMLAIPVFLKATLRTARGEPAQNEKAAGPYGQ